VTFWDRVFASFAIWMGKVRPGGTHATDQMAPPMPAGGPPKPPGMLAITQRLSGCNFTPWHGSSDRPIKYLVIHCTEGGWEGACSWFDDKRAQASAHFVIRSHDGLIAQCVKLNDIAWHAGNWDYNASSIGIEFEGYVKKPEFFTDLALDRGAQLVADLCLHYGLIPTRKVIIGHNQVPDPRLGHAGQLGGAGNHDDPGPGFPWDRFMALVDEYFRKPTPSPWALPGEQPTPKASA
jgi:N-acetyl-anhydromuramyl-L-alanine amidase AmpD